MRAALLLALAIVPTQAALAQCGTAPPQRLATQEPFAFQFFVGSTPQPPGLFGVGLLLDVQATMPVQVHGFDTALYDDGEQNPDLVGRTAVALVYAGPTTRIGNEQLPPGPGSPWTLVATGTITIAAHELPSPITLAQPFALPVGNHGLAVVLQAVDHGTPTQQPLHPLIRVASEVPPPPAAASDGVLTLANQLAQRAAFTTMPGTVGQAINLAVRYDLPADAAWTRSHGPGCSDRVATFAEVLTAAAGGNPFDLANGSLRLVPHQGGYLVRTGVATLIPPSSPSLTLDPPLISFTWSGWDDTVSQAQPLGFTFAWPGGSTQEVWLSADGQLWLQTPQHPLPFAGHPHRWARDAAALSVAYGDYDLTQAGSLHFETDGASTSARATWIDVPAKTSFGSRSSFQAVLHADGAVDFVWGAMAIARPTIVGFTPGNDFDWSTTIDLSAAVPFGSGDGAFAPVLAARSRPILGATARLEVTRLATGTTFGLLLLGALPQAPLDLAAFGLPDCHGRVDIPVLAVHGTAANAGALPFQLSIPNSPALDGLLVASQAVPFSPGFNAAGLLVSNGLCLTVGGR